MASEVDDITLSTHIERIIKPYIDLAMRQPLKYKKIAVPILKNIPGSDEDKIPLLRIPAFVYLVNSSLQSDANFTLPYIASIYKMAGMTHSCNGIISIKYLSMKTVGDKIILDNFKTATPQEKQKFKPYLYFRGNPDVYVPVLNDPESAQKYIQHRGYLSRVHLTHPKGGNPLKDSLINRFLGQYKNSNCRFISIGLSLKAVEGGHSNMLLIYKGQTKIYLMLYEPHGAKGLQIEDEYKLQYKNMTDQFITFLTGIIRQTGERREIIRLPAYNISESRGIQRYMRDTDGYCSMITSFWLYIILRLVKEHRVTGNEEKFFLNLNYIEKCMYCIINRVVAQYTTENPQPQGIPSRYTAARVLYSVVVYFSYIFLTENYLAYFIPGTELYNKFTTILRHKYTKSRKNDPITFNETIFVHDIDDHATNLTQEDLERNELNAIAKTDRVLDNMPCITKKQCQSHNCDTKIGLCKPIDYNDSRDEDKQYSLDEESSPDEEYSADEQPSEESSPDEDTESSDDTHMKKRNSDDDTEISLRRRKISRVQPRMFRKKNKM
jgi:hypothetical protein